MTRGYTSIYRNKPGFGTYYVLFIKVQLFFFLHIQKASRNAKMKLFTLHEKNPHIQDIERKIEEQQLKEILEVISQWI